MVPRKNREAESEGDIPSPFARLVDSLVKVGGFSVLITGLLYYFGRAFQTATYAYFGLDPSVMAFSTQDYLSATVRPAFIPLLAALLFVGILLSLYLWLKEEIRKSERLQIAFWGSFALAGIILLAGAVLTFGVLPAAISDYWKPTFIGTGACALLGLLRVPHPTPLNRWSASAPLQLVLVMLASISLLGAWDLYASAAGTSQGRSMAEDLAYQPAVVIYSTNHLAINGPGITVTPLNPANSPYTTSYQGLRFLTKAVDGSIVLVPIGWRQGTDPIFIIKDLPGVRWDIISMQP